MITQSADKITLVTGATGFTGSRLVKALVRDGERTRVIARSAQRAQEILPPSVEIIEGDLAEAGVIERAMVGYPPCITLRRCTGKPSTPTPTTGR